MPCYCSKIIQYQNDISRVESALTQIGHMRERSDGEIAVDVTSLAENLYCASPDNLSDLILLAGEIDDIPAAKITTMETGCTGCITALQEEIDVMTTEDSAFHEAEAAAAAAAANGGSV